MTPSDFVRGNVAPLRAEIANLKAQRDGLHQANNTLLARARRAERRELADAIAYVATGIMTGFIIAVLVGGVQ